MFQDLQTRKMRLNKLVEIKVEQKMKELIKTRPVPVTAAARRGGIRVPFQRQRPKPTDICRVCHSRVHRARSCPNLNEVYVRAGQGPHFQP